MEACPSTLKFFEMEEYKMERPSPMPGEIYRHFKNRLYQIVGVATYSENKEKLVIYQALYGGFGMYARPYDMFMSEVDRKKYPEVTQKYRFEKVGRAGGEPETIVEDSVVSTVPDIKQSIADKQENIVRQENTGEEAPNADLVAFLDAETYEEKRALLIAMRPRITDRLINDMAAALDITVDEGDLESRFKSLLFCVSKMDEFEITRLR